MANSRALCFRVVTYQLTPLMLKGVPSAKSLPPCDSKLISQCVSPEQVSCQAVGICTRPLARVKLGSEWGADTERHAPARNQQVWCIWGVMHGLFTFGCVSIERALYRAVNGEKAHSCELTSSRDARATRHPAAATGTASHNAQRRISTLVLSAHRL